MGPSVKFHSALQSKNTDEPKIVKDYYKKGEHIIVWDDGAKNVIYTNEKTGKREVVKYRTDGTIWGAAVAGSSIPKVTNTNKPVQVKQVQKVQETQNKPVQLKQAQLAPLTKNKKTLPPLTQVIDGDTLTYYSKTDSINFNKEYKIIDDEYLKKWQVVDNEYLKKWDIADKEYLKKWDIADKEYSKKWEVADAKGDDVAKKKIFAEEDKRKAEIFAEEAKRKSEIFAEEAKRKAVIFNEEDSKKAPLYQKHCRTVKGYFHKK